jgi:hypothetical protein
LSSHHQAAAAATAAPCFLFLVAARFTQRTTGPTQTCHDDRSTVNENTRRLPAQ